MLSSLTGTYEARGFRNRECGDPAESIHSGQSETELRCGGTSPKADSGNDRLMARVLRLPRRPPELRKKGREDARNRAPPWTASEIGPRPYTGESQSPVPCGSHRCSIGAVRGQAELLDDELAWPLSGLGY